MGAASPSHYANCSPRQELTEKLAPKLPPAVLQAGFHPRLLASYHVLALLLAQLALLATPSLSSVLLRFVWWLAFLAAVALGVLLALRWRRTHRPSYEVDLEKWAPWAADQVRPR